MSDFLAFALKSIAQVIKPALESLDSSPNEFDSFDDILKLYEGGIDLPNNLLDDIRKDIPFEMLKEIFRTDGDLLKFPMPQVIEGIVHVNYIYENLPYWRLSAFFSIHVLMFQ